VFSLSAVQTNAQIQQGEIKMAQADNAKAMADIQLALKKIDKGLQTHRVPKPIFPPFEILDQIPERSRRVRPMTITISPACSVLRLLN